MRYDPSVAKPVYTIVPGIYPATITKAEEKNSKRGNPMMVIELEAYTTDGKSKFVKDYIMVGGEYPQDWRLKNLAKAVGLNEDGEINASDLLGRSMNVQVGIKPAKGSYGESNDVKDYYKPKAEVEDNGAMIGRDFATDTPARAPAIPRPAAIGGGISVDQEPPFMRDEYLGA